MIRQSKSSQDDEFEDLTLGYVDQMFRLGYARLGNFADAEDVVQETYLKAYRSFGTFSRKTSIKNWLTAILINAVRDHLRKNARTLPTLEIDNDRDGGEPLYEPVARSPEDELCENEIDPALMGALKSMPEEFLVPLLLREIQDASYEEIATILEIPKGTVMSRLARARALLRKKLLSQPDSQDPTHSSLKH